MGLKSLLFLSAMAAVPAMSFAAEYYVTPDGAGTKDGSSWENAFGVAEFRTQAANNGDGDVYNFAGGLFNLSESTVVFKTATGATLIGNADGERTVFSGDKNGNNNPGDGDAGRLIRLQTNTKSGDTSKPVIVENIDFTCVYTNVNEKEAGSTVGAFVVDNCGYVLVKGCRFHGNWAQGGMGGPAAAILRSNVKFQDCMFYSNSGNYRGGAFRIYSKDAGKGDVTLENCIVKNNKNYHNLGGAIFMGHGHSLNIINSTITGNSVASGSGAAIYFNGYDADHNRVVSIVNSTIAGNTSGVADDAQIVSTNTAHLNIANSIITSDAETAAIKITGDTIATSFQFQTGGYNVVGNMIMPADAELAWEETDHEGEAYTYDFMFSDHKLGADNVIKPATFVLGATGAQVTDAVASWGLPSGLDLTVDQLGNARVEGVTPGAYAINEAQTTRIDAVINDSDVQLVNIAGDIYALNGYAGTVTVYSVSGMAVLNTPATSIDLSGLGAGLYVLQAGNNIFKVVK